MLDKIKAFQEEATKLGRNPNSIDELKMWLQAMDRKQEIEAFKKGAEEEFLTKLDRGREEVSIYDRPEGVDDHEIDSCEVSWILYQDYRSWGIKDIYPSVRKIRVTGRWVTFTDVEEDEEQPFTLEIAPEEWHITEDYRQARFEQGLIPRDIDIDFKTKKVTVSF